MTTQATTSDPSFLKRLESLLALALSSASAGLRAFVAASNNVFGVAAATGVAAVVPYVAIAAPTIDRKVSGKFLVTGFVTIDKNGGTLAAGDAIVLTPRVNGVQLGTFLVETAAVTSGATVQAYAPFSFVASTAVAVGSPVIVDMQLTTAAGTSSVLVNNGFITVMELPG